MTHPTFTRLRANGRRSPLGVASATVRLTWIARRELSDGDSIIVEVSDGLDSAGGTAHALPASARSLTVDLPSGRWASWRVGHAVADAVDWSETAWFTTAPELDAHWVTHPDVLNGRAEGDDRTVWFAFDIESAPDERILLHLAAPGIVDVRVDGLSVSPNRLGPGYSELTSEVSAVTHDLGELAPGAHVITVEVASGPYWIAATPRRYAKFTAHGQAPRLLALVEQFGATTTVTATTPALTRTGRGPTTEAHWYGGETYDAGLPAPGHGGVPAVEAPTHATVWWPEHPPITVVDTLAATSATGGVLDFGVNIAGVPRLTWQGAADDRTLVLYPAEMLGTDGVDQDSTGTPIFDTLHIPAGSAGSWSPSFGYHGFRYLDVRGPAAGVEVDALVLRAANEPAGRFSSGDPFLRQLHSAVDRAVQGNMHSIFTDCPHREKLGWLEQLHFCFGAIVRNYDVEAHLRDMLHHARRAQLESGAIPNTVPEFVNFTGHRHLDDDEAFRFDVNWGGIIVHLPLDHYLQYGDLGVLHENVPAMKAYLTYLRGQEQNGLIDFGLGDWISIDTSTPRRLVASHGYLSVLEAAAVIASLVLDDTWSAALRERIAVVSTALRALGSSGPDASQSELVILVDLARRAGDDVALDRHRASLLQRIARDGNAFTVGEITFGMLVRTVHEAGHGDLILSIIRRTDVPGYGTQLARGITALAETWSAERQAVGEGSNNHFMLGMIDDWMHENVAGLVQAPGSVGWRQALVSPTFLAGVPSAESVHESPLGRYEVSWQRETDDTVRVNVVVPPDGSALIRVAGIPEHVVAQGAHTFWATAGAAHESELVATHD